MRLGEAAKRAGYRLTVFETIGSTNDAALSAASQGDAGNHWFVAHAQSAGRGRSGRQWASEPGNLFATLLLIDPCRTVDLPKLGFVAGVALHQAVAAVAPDFPGLRLKWPNDLLADGAKLAGILLEGRALADGRQAVAVGIGVNCASHPEGLPYPATCLSAFNGPTTPLALFLQLSDRIAANLTLFAGASGFEAVRRAWLAAAYGLEAPIVVRLGEEQRQGVFAGIDAEGRLLLDTAGRREVIHAADVLFPAATPGGPQSASTQGSAPDARGIHT